MKDFRELVSLRRSMRKYTADALPADDVATILRAALMAPSSKGTRCPEYILVDDEGEVNGLCFYYFALECHNQEKILWREKNALELGDSDLAETGVEGDTCVIGAGCRKP